MSNFLNKLKQGVSDAGKKAQQTVESTTLKFQVASKEKEIEKNYTEIGRIVYRSLEDQTSFVPNAEYQKYREAIVNLEQEIEELNRKIQQLQNLKECGCGKMLLKPTRPIVRFAVSSSKPSCSNRPPFRPKKLPIAQDAGRRQVRRINFAGAAGFI